MGKFDFRFFRYVELPVAIPVKRLIEKPVPADAMTNSIIMDAYTREAPLLINRCTQQCGPVSAQTIPASKMNEQELQQVRGKFFLSGNQKPELTKSDLQITGTK